MPILALPRPSVVHPGGATIAGLTTPDVFLIGGNGDVIPLTGSDQGFLLLSERGLFAPPPPGPRFRDGAGDGSRWDGSRRPARIIDMSVRVEGDTMHDFNLRRGRLAEAVDDQYGTATLRVVCPTCGPDAAREIAVVLSGGFTGEGSGFAYQAVPLTFTAPAPHFRAVTPVVVPWKTPTGTPLLSTTRHFFPIGLTSSQVLGSVLLTNPGDVASIAEWTIAGVGGQIEISSGLSGQGFTISGTRSATDVLVADGDAKTLTDGTGANRYDLFGPAPKLWKIPPGESVAQVAVTSAGPSTLVTLRFWPQFKLAI